MSKIADPSALAALRTWLASFDSTTRERGQAYFAAGHVEDVWKQRRNIVSADVIGQEHYEVSLRLYGRNWRAMCSCPMGFNCKHVYATGLAWLSKIESKNDISEAVDDDFDDDDFGEATPPAPFSPLGSFSRRPLPRAASVVASDPGSKSLNKIPFREQWTPVLAEKLGRPLTAEEGHQLGQLSALFNEFQQSHSTLYASMMLKHGFGHLLSNPSVAYTPLFAGWWTYDESPADPWALWQYIAFDAQRAGRALPAAFLPFTDTGRIGTALQDRLVREELDTWRRSFAAPLFVAIPGEAQAGTGLAGLRVRFERNGELHLELRAALDKPWKAPTQKWLTSLGTAHPADFEHLTAGESALALALAAQSRSYPYITPKFALAPETVASLLRSAGARGAIFLPDGKPFSVEPSPLVPEAVVSATALNRLDLRLVTPSGEDATSAYLITRYPEPLYLFADRIWRGPPPAPARTLPTAALADPGLMSRLRATGLRFPESLALKIRRVALRPLLRCWLTQPTGQFEPEAFRAQLFARSTEPSCEQVWAGSGGWQWTKTGAPPPRRSDDPHFDFDLLAAQAVGARFADFRLGWYEWENAWARQGTKNFPEEFSAWHASLPPGTDIELSPELAGLIGPPLRAHVDFSALPVDGGHDWFDLTIALRVEDSTLTPDEIALLLKARGKWVRLPARGWRRLELATSTDDAASAALDRLGLVPEEVLATGKAATHRLHALQLAGEASALESRDAKLADALRTRAASIAALPPPTLPAGLSATLRPYQAEGFHFLCHLSAHGFGGVLADDMGLGKTVQTLAWLLHLAASGSREPERVDTSTQPRSRKRLPAPAAKAFRALVICPKSVTHGWLAETARFAPKLAATAFTPALAIPKPETPDPKPSSAPAASVLVANYTQLRLHAEWFQSGAWDAVVLDEGQFIKNPTSQAALVARALATRHRLVLTGTPVENRLTDLWSLFAFAQPGLLGTQAAFKRQHPETDPAALARLRRRVTHFLLRRTKAQAAPDLPSRTEDDLVVELEPAQRKLYDAELKRARAQLLGIETARALDAVRFNVLASLLRLRQICCHPALVDPTHADLPSAKLDALLERLDALRDEGHQVLVFSQFVGMLELIRVRLAAADIGYLILTGASENRADLVNTFQTDRTKTVFLLSLKAAGFGLNLTAASYAILYDPWWNPAAEAQAIDRTHRIGQTRPVTAYRLLAANTVEQKIRALQKEKSALAAAVVQEETLATVLDLASLRAILE